MYELVSYINKFVSEFKDVQLFKEHLRNFYINEKLVHHIRRGLIVRETMRYHRSIRRRSNIEPCVISSPYCFFKKDSIFNNDTNIVMRSEDVLINLKPNYFDVGTEMQSYQINYMKKYTDDTFTDSLYRRKTAILLESPSLKNNLNESSLATLYVHSQMVASSIRKMTKSCKLTKISVSGRTNACTALAENEKQLEALIIRSYHVCSYKALAIARKEKMNKAKIIFFERISNNLYKHFTIRLKKHMLAVLTRVTKPMKVTKGLFTKNRLLRHSFNETKREKSEVGKRLNHSYANLIQDFEDREDSLAQKSELTIFKSTNSTINGQYHMVSGEDSCFSGADDFFADGLRPGNGISMEMMYSQFGRNLADENVA